LNNNATLKESFELLKTKWKSAIIGSVLTLIVGFASSLLSGGFDAYGTLTLPPFSPPPWLFPIVWTVLYILTGGCAGLLFASMCQSGDKDKATLLYITMLLFNFLWSPLFFGLSSYFAALVDLLIIISTTAAMIPYYRKCLKLGVWVTFLYLAWLIYALYLNIGVVILN